jgi:N-acyl-D-aspartate/D-glutamate deacylase
MLGSDGIYQPGGHVHPRVYGSAGCWLGPLVRNRKLFSLEEAVHKLSGKSATRFGLPDRGVIRQGAFADLVVFDPASIADCATYDEPQRPCTGVEHVVVNGRLVIENGTAVSTLAQPLPGRFIKRQFQ